MVLEVVEGSPQFAAGTVLLAVWNCVAPGGQLTCPEIDPCAASCKGASTGKTQGQCTFECLKQATVEEGLRFLELMLCGSVTCAQKCANAAEPGCLDTCRQTECKALTDKCLGP